MPVRINPLITGDIVHVMNRGVARQLIHRDARDYRLALEGLRYYRHDELPMRYSHFRELKPLSQFSILAELETQVAIPLVDVLGFTFMPNHWHLLLRQRVDGGITTFLRRWTNSYTRFFNTRHERIGPLFQGVFKSVGIHSDELLLHVSRYIHLNLVVAGMLSLNKLRTDPRSSFGQYVGDQATWCDTQLILDLTGSVERYELFVADHVDYGKQLEQIKHLTLE